MSKPRPKRTANVQPDRKFDPSKKSATSEWWDRIVEDPRFVTIQHALKQRCPQGPMIIQSTEHGQIAAMSIREGWNEAIELMSTITEYIEESDKDEFASSHA